MKPVPHSVVLLLIAFATAVVPAVGGIARAAERPNVVWIMSEDNSKHYLRLFDPTGAATPNIEALARDGIVFDRAFSNSPVCSVARTTLITSCYAPRIGTQFHRHQRLATLPKGLRMFPAYLRDAGYYTTNNRKEDYNAVKSDDVWDESSGKASWRNRPEAEQPFFHVSTFTMSHESSLHFPPSLLEEEPTKTSPESVTLAPYHADTPLFRYTYARYHDRIGLIDKAVGEVVEQLRKDGVLEDTFIFYFGDHGGVLPRGKGYLYESGLHVPLVVRVPSRWQQHVALPRGSRSDGFVEFVDFGPTVLHLAGAKVPEGVDGRPFLGPQVSPEELANRDETIGYADRFDEKYDLVRSLRQGRWKYIRNYEAFNPDGLQNNYRYKMLAYQQWREMDRRGELNETQRQFFEPKAVEALYDLRTDPYEIHNLAADPRHAARLSEMRERLRQRLKAMPDLSFVPESVLVEQALDAPVAYGQTHADQIARLIDTVDLSLLPFREARKPLAAALGSDDWMQRYWALVACLCHSEQANELIPLARQRLEDPQPLVRVRAAQFLGVVEGIDPRPAIYEALRSTDSPTEALEILNVVVFFQDQPKFGYAFEPEQIEFKFQPAAKGEVTRRLDYLRESRRSP